MRRFLLMLAAALPLVAHAQAPPWLDEGWRDLNYPTDEWYSGFAQDRLQVGGDIATALKAIERSAQNQLAESIIVKIDGGTQVENAAVQRQGNEITSTEYRQFIVTATSATAVRSDVRTFHNPSSGYIYAFATVRRADLAAFYAKQIEVDLNKAALAVEMSGQLAAAGKKMSARRKVEEATEVFASVASLRNLLVAVDASAGDGSLQSERGGELQRTVERLLIDLEQSTAVYIDATDEHGIFTDIAAQVLNENGCRIVESPEEADFELTLQTSAAVRSDGSGQYGILSYYANVKGTLFNRMTQKRVAEFSVLNDPAAYSAGRTPDDAIAKAFKLPALREKVMGKILPKIKN